MLHFLFRFLLVVGCNLCVQSIHGQLPFFPAAGDWLRALGSWHGWGRASENLTVAGLVRHACPRRSRLFPVRRVPATLTLGLHAASGLPTHLLTTYLHCVHRVPAEALHAREYQGLVVWIPPIIIFNVVRRPDFWTW